VSQIIKTLSISPEQEEFLKENPDLSPSKILQVKINEIMNDKKFFQADYIKLQKANKQLAELLQEANAEIDELKKELQFARGKYD